MAVVPTAWDCDRALSQRLFSTSPRSTIPNTLTLHGMLWLDQTLSSFSGHLVIYSFIHSFSNHVAPLMCQALC